MKNSNNQEKENKNYNKNQNMRKDSQGSESDRKEKKILEEKEKSNLKDERYIRIKELGVGSFGKAYLVKRESNNQHAVIKTMILEGMREEEKKEAFMEAKILKSLNHSNIIKFIEVFRQSKPKSTLNIVMEHAEGGDLFAKIRNQATNEDVILDWFTQICLAIRYIHKKKILHRDLKSKNIFLSKNSLVKLGDFGIAKCLNTTLDIAKTMVGTPYYLSPEMVRNEPYSFKSDVWALGVLLYEMTCLKMPFDAKSLPMLSVKIMNGEYNQIPIQYSKDLSSLLKLMLNPVSQNRPSIDDILKHNIIKKRINSFLNEIDIGEMEQIEKIIKNKISNNNKNDCKGNTNNNSGNSKMDNKDTKENTISTKESKDNSSQRNSCLKKSSSKQINVNEITEIIKGGGCSLINNKDNKDINIIKTNSNISGGSNHQHNDSKNQGSCSKKKINNNNGVNESNFPYSSNSNNHNQIISSPNSNKISKGKDETKEKEIYQSPQILHQDKLKKNFGNVQNLENNNINAMFNHNKQKTPMSSKESDKKICKIPSDIIKSIPSSLIDPKFKHKENREQRDSFSKQSNRINLNSSNNNHTNIDENNSNNNGGGLGLKKPGSIDSFSQLKSKNSGNINQTKITNQNPGNEKQNSNPLSTKNNNLIDKEQIQSNGNQNTPINIKESNSKNSSQNKNKEIRSLNDFIKSKEFKMYKNNAVTTEGEKGDKKIIRRKIPKNSNKQVIKDQNLQNYFNDKEKENKPVIIKGNSIDRRFLLLNSSGGASLNLTNQSKTDNLNNLDISKNNSNLLTSSHGHGSSGSQNSNQLQHHNIQYSINNVNITYVNNCGGGNNNKTPFDSINSYNNNNKDIAEENIKIEQKNSYNYVKNPFLDEEENQENDNNNNNSNNQEKIDSDRKDFKSTMKMLKEMNKLKRGESISSQDSNSSSSSYKKQAEKKEENENNSDLEAEDEFDVYYQHVDEPNFPNYLNLENKENLTTKKGGTQKSNNNNQNFETYTLNMQEQQEYENLDKLEIEYKEMIGYKLYQEVFEIIYKNTPDNYFWYDKNILEAVIRKECEDFKDEKVELAIKYIPDIFNYFVFRDKEKKFKLTFVNTKFNKK